MPPAVAAHEIAHATRPDRLLDTSTSTAVALWHEVLTLQVDLFHAAEIAAFAASSAWRSSRSVLEAGCGNGRAKHQTECLHDFAPLGNRGLGGIAGSPDKT